MIDLIRLLLLVLVFVAKPLSYLNAQSVNVIEIRYEVFVENADSLSSYQYNLPYEAYHLVSPDHVLTLNKYAADVDEVHLYDLENLIDYRCYIRGEDGKIAVKSPLAQIPTLLSNTNDDKIYQVGGMRCKRYEIFHKHEAIEIFTTDAFGVNFTPFSQVEGYAMQYTFVDEVYGKVTYVAKSIYPTVTSEETFRLDDFKVTDKIFPQDLRDSFGEEIINKESRSLFKLNKRKIGYKFRLVDKSKVTETSDPNSLVVMAVCGFHKLSPLDRELLKGLISSMKDRDVKFYYFGMKHIYSKNEIKDLEDAGFEVSFLKDLILTKFKVKYFPTYILLDKDRKVAKYKIGTNSEMLASFGEKIIELSEN